MNRRELIHTGLAAVGSMAIPFRLAFALSESRSTTVTKGLELATTKPYSDISEIDLLAIEVLHLPHVHIDSFLNVDFAGLTNVKDLSFHSVFHSVPGLPVDIFRSMPNLKKLSLDSNQFEELPQDVFAPLEGLKVLDLTYSAFGSETLPASIFRLPSIESIITRGLDRVHFQMLKDHYGDIVVG